MIDDGCRGWIGTVNMREDEEGGMEKEVASGEAGRRRRRERQMWRSVKTRAAICAGATEDGGIERRERGRGGEQEGS